MNLFGQSPTNAKQLLQAEITQRKAACKKRNAFFEEYDRLYFLQHYGVGKAGKIKGKKGIEAQVNDATTQVNIMRQLIGVKDLHIKVFPRYISQGELEAGSEIERWIWAVLEANNDRQEADVLDLALFDTIRLGWGAIYSYWDQDLANQSRMMMPAQEPGMQAMPIITECPIVLQKISPYYIYPESGGHQGRWRSFLIIEPEKNALEIAQEWGVKPKKLKEAKPGEQHRVTVEYTVYWGWERIENAWYVVNCVMADNEMIRQPTIMEGYDALPITLFFCVPTGDARWEYMSLSCLFPIHLHVKLLDHLMSRLHKQVDIFTNLPLYHKKARGGPGSQLSLPKGMYNLIELETGEDVGFPQWPGNAPDFHALFNYERQKIQEGGFSSLAMGETIPISGIAASRLWESNIVKLIEPSKTFTRGLKSLLNKVKSLAIQFAPDIPISLITNYPKASGNVILMGQQLQPYILSPELAGELPMDQFRRLALGLQFAQLGERSPLSLETLYEKFLDIDQPEEEFAKKLVDIARQSKTIRLLQTWQYLQSQGFNIPLEFLAQVEGAMGGGMAMGQQQPPMREAVSTAMSPYESGISTLAEEQFQGEPPAEQRLGLLEGAAAVQGGFAGRFGR